MTEGKVVFDGCDVVMSIKNAKYERDVSYRWSIFATFARNEVSGDMLIFDNFAEIRKRLQGLATSLTWHARTKFGDGKWIASGSKGSPHARREVLGQELWTYFDIEDVDGAVAYCTATGERIFNLQVRLAETAVGDNSRSFLESDTPLLEEMNELIVRGEVKSVEDAANQVAPRAKRLGSLESAVQRLQRRFGAKYPQRKREAHS